MQRARKVCAISVSTMETQPGINDATSLRLSQP